MYIHREEIRNQAMERDGATQKRANEDCEKNLKGSLGEELMLQNF